MPVLDRVTWLFLASFGLVIRFILQQPHKGRPTNQPITEKGLTGFTTSSKIASFTADSRAAFTIPESVTMPGSKEAATSKAAVTQALIGFIIKRECACVTELFGQLEWVSNYDYKAEQSRS